jgi:hypothetical protein
MIRFPEAAGLTILYGFGHSISTAFRNFSMIALALFISRILSLRMLLAFKNINGFTKVQRIIFIPFKAKIDQS